MQTIKGSVGAAVVVIAALQAAACTSRRIPQQTAYDYESPTNAPELAALRRQLTTVESKSSKRGVVVTIPDGFFEVDKAELRAGARPDLMAIAAYLKEHPGRKALIEGHTDSTGSPAHNVELSRRRATSVEAFLLRNGVDPERIVARGVGEAEPVATNRTAAGRQQNRRVEIVMIDAGATATR
jgi:outer membrane protein OmpA-like peptidoglycan-associated protein